MSVGKPTLYILGHGNNTDSNIYSQNGKYKTPRDIYNALNRNTSYLPNFIEKIKVFTCHGGTENGPAHELKRLLNSNRIRIFGYTSTTYDPISSNPHKYAGSTYGTTRASSVRYELNDNYTDVAITFDTITLETRDDREQTSWCSCG